MDGFPILGQPDTGDTAWMLASSALVLLMTPGLAFFYGGMVRAKGVLNMIMMSFSSIGIVSVLWVIVGYTLAFAPDRNGKGLIGNLSLRFLHGETQASVTNHLFDYAFIAFQLIFFDRKGHAGHVYFPWYSQERTGHHDRQNRLGIGGK